MKNSLQLLLHFIPGNRPTEPSSKIKSQELVPDVERRLVLRRLQVGLSWSPASTCSPRPVKTHLVKGISNSSVENETNQNMQLLKADRLLDLQMQRFETFLTWTRSYKENFSIGLRYAGILALWLGKMVKWHLSAYKNQRSIELIYAENIFIWSGPGQKLRKCLSSKRQKKQNRFKPVCYRTWDRAERCRRGRGCRGARSASGWPRRPEARGCDQLTGKQVF